MLMENMTSIIGVVFYLFSFIVLSASSAEVYFIDAKSKTGNVHRLTMSNDDNLMLEPVRLDDSMKAEAEKLYELYKRPDAQKLSNKQHRIFGNMFGSPTKLKSIISKKYRRPTHDMRNQMKSLEPIIKYLLNQQNSVKYNFHDLTRKERPEKISEDYVDFGDFSRVQSAPDFSQDYIDFRLLRKRPKAHRLRRATEVAKEALERAYTDSDEDSDDDEDTKSKRFEVVKNKHNKKDIKSDSDEKSDEDDGAKKKKSVKKSNEEIDSDQNLSDLSDIETKHKKRKAKTKDSEENEENEDERPELYLQGNKLTVYPPATADSIEADSDDDSRRSVAQRRLRMPYFLPKRYHWQHKDIRNLGYYFFNGPKGVSLESD